MANRVVNKSSGGAGGRSPRHARFVRVAGLLGLLFVASALWLSGTALAGVWTDKDDYAPGSTVYITGDGMDPNESVRVEVYFPDGSNAQTHYVVASDAGDFEDSYVLPNPTQPGSYAVVATGLSSYDDVHRRKALHRNHFTHDSRERRRHAVHAYRHQHQHE